MTVGGIVLAAGASLRMGSPKALLKIGKTTFLQHVVAQLRAGGVEDIAIVLGADADEIRNSLSWFEGAIIVNQNWKKGQLSSVVAGLEALSQKKFDGILVWPVDRPLITHALIKNLVASFQESGTKIIIPTFWGKRGHPTIFPSTMFDELRTAPLTVGARHVIRNRPNDTLELTANEEGVLINIDLPEDYERYVLSKTGQK